MARYLTTIPNNLGYFNLGTVESYPTGGTGPTAYGPTSYYGSDPLPASDGDSINNALDLGDFVVSFRPLTLTNTHGGLSRKQSTFYKFTLTAPRSVQFTQNYSQFSYENNTNRNTLLAFYHIQEGNVRKELPINNLGYVYKTTGIDYDESLTLQDDYPTTRLEPGCYAFVITNDIRYLETTYSITIFVGITDWRYVYEDVRESLDFGFVTQGVGETLDFGDLALA